jgi:hypothetical protein
MTYANSAAWTERQRLVSSTRAIEPERKLPTQHSSSYTGDQRWQVKSELWNLFEDCNTENWDGYGAKGITPESLNVGLEFLDQLPAFVANPEVTADPDGEISFEWFKSDDMILTLSVSSERKIAFAGIFGQERPHGIENFGLEIPSTVLMYLSRYFGNIIPLAQG